MLLRPCVLSYCGHVFCLIALTFAAMCSILSSVFTLYIVFITFRYLLHWFTLFYSFHTVLFSYHWCCLISYSQILFQVLYTIFLHTIVYSILSVQNCVAAYYCLFHLFTLYGFYIASSVVSSICLHWSFFLYSFQCCLFHLFILYSFGIAFSI